MFATFESETPQCRNDKLPKARSTMDHRRSPSNIESGSKELYCLSYVKLCLKIRGVENYSLLLAKYFSGYKHSKLPWSLPGA